MPTAQMPTLGNFLEPIIAGAANDHRYRMTIECLYLTKSSTLLVYLVAVSFVHCLVLFCLVEVNDTNIPTVPYQKRTYFETFILCTVTYRYYICHQATRYSSTSISMSDG